METIITKHIISRYMKRLRERLPIRDIKYILEKTYINAETIVSFKQYSKFSPNELETVIIKAVDNFVIVGVQREKLRLVTCFFEQRLNRFFKYAGQTLPVEQAF
jgi:hypothetical protein